MDDFFSGYMSGYRKAGGAPIVALLGAALGLAARTVAQTFIVVIVLRMMGVL